MNYIIEKCPKLKPNGKQDHLFILPKHIFNHEFKRFNFSDLCALLISYLLFNHRISHLVQFVMEIKAEVVAIAMVFQVCVFYQDVCVLCNFIFCFYIYITCSEYCQ